MSYSFTADNIEVRSLKEGNQGRYVVNGRGMVSGIKDTYQFAKNRDGTYKTFHSMFTENCLKSIKEQAQHKRLFVDAQHDLALNINIRSMLKDKLSAEELSKIDKMLKMKELPLAKLNDIDITDNSLMVYSEMNPAFRELDQEHQAYFDSVWYSLQNKFLNGISVNFANPKVIEDSDGTMVIDDVEVLGFSYVDAPASHENSIMEVAIRAMQEGGKMSEENEKKIAEERAKLEAERKEIEAEKSKIAEEKAKYAEEAKKAEIERQKAEQQKMNEDLSKKAEELKRKEEELKAKEGEMNSAKGQVPPKDKYGQQQKSQYDPAFYEKNLKEITSEHDRTITTIREGKAPSVDRRMSGFAELVNLQAKINNPTAGMKPEDVQFAMEHGLLKRSDGDILAPRAK